MTVLLHDVRYAARVMLKARGLTLVAVITLALGIGANTAIFSVVNALLLRPLPYTDPDRLVMVWQDLRARGGPATEWTGPSQHFDWKRATDVFDNLASLRGWNATLGGGTMPEAFLGEQTTFEYFDVLGARPALGRTFRQEDDLPNVPRVAILSHAMWTQRFGGDAAVVGRVVTINGEPHEVIGVMPRDFTPGLVTNAAIWRPLRMDPVNPPRHSAVNRTIGRLKAGVSIEQARAALATLARQLERDHPESDARKGINPIPMQEQKVGGVKPAVYVLQGAVAFVLLIACVNIANLLLSRASGRIREIAVRRALGADRMRIVRQLLTESVMLAVIGGGLGMLLGVWGVTALKAIAPEGTPRIAEVGVDGAVLAFSALLSLVTGLVFGLVPALHAARDRFTPALNQGGRGQAGEGGGRARRALIVAEIALALMLLAGGGLLLRTFVALQRADLGFDPDRVLTGFVLTPPAQYRTNPQRRAFYDAVLERAGALPGVRYAALSSVVPLGGDSDTTFFIEGRPAASRSADALTTWYRVVSANYFDAMGIPLRRGRLIAEREAEPTVVINETMAKRFWPGEDPLGRRIRYEADGPWFTIVGIVADVQVRGARGTHAVESYLGYWHNPEPGVNIVLKTDTDPAALMEPLRRAVMDVDRGIAISSLSTMSAMIADANAAPRFNATLVAIFAALALLLAAVGIYGVMSYGVAQRTPEIGVRVALGAGRGEIYRMVLGDAARLTVAGVAIGLAAAVPTARLLAAQLYGVTPGDPITYAVIAVLLAIVGLGATLVPAYRAARVDPIVALRAE